ncbi:MAG: hypothetical protein PHC66_04935 [Candidatus Nanoarchaeia archaeon]|nr:hypothetical protein [Candidatus Nanoarchaeia archaeon]MDD5238903.1 hypothetical protein [Candidatus Nanoarchaeia archaeon]
MATLTTDYNLKEIIVDYDKDKGLLNKLIESGQVRPFETEFKSIPNVPNDAMQIGPTFRFESKSELTEEDAMKIILGYVHRRASFYTWDVDGKAATLKSFANPEKARLIQFPDNYISIYV